MRIHYFNDFQLRTNEVQSLHVIEVCKSLKNLGNEVTLFTLRSSASQIEEIKVRDVPSSNYFGKLKSFIFQVQILPKVVRLWSKDRPDAIYMRASIYLILPIYLAKLFSIPIFVEVNGLLEEEIDDHKPRFYFLLTKTGYIRFIERRVYGNAKKIITVTPTIKNHLAKKYKIAQQKIVVIENGVNPDELKQLKGTKQEDFTLGFVGGFADWQGLPFVIQAMKIVLRTIPKARFVIVGDGPEKQQLEELSIDLGIKDSIYFLGSIDHKQVPRIINSFTACIAYYIKSRAGLASPFKIYEYLACAKPVIVSNIDGFVENFGQTVIVADAENPINLAKSIVTVFQDESLQKKLSRSSRQYILNGHTWNHVARNIIQVMGATQ